VWIKILIATQGGVWDQRINDLYAKLFDVDLLHSIRPGGKMTRPIVPIFTPWTRVKVLANVRPKDLARWADILDTVDQSFGIQ
jgi:hypothetical protein